MKKLYTMPSCPEPNPDAPCPTQAKRIERQTKLNAVNRLLVVGRPVKVAREFGCTLEDLFDWAIAQERERAALATQKAFESGRRMLYPLRRAA